HPRGASPHRLFNDLPPRTPCDAAPHAPRDRKELSADMTSGPWGAALFYFGRLLQVIAMWILLVDVFTAGPMGPQPNPFYVGTAMFIIGWLMVRRQSK